MVDTLVTGNFDCVEKRKEVENKKVQKRFLKRILHIKEYLKYFYYTHIGIDDDYFHRFHNAMYKHFVLDAPREAMYM